MAEIVSGNKNLTLENFVLIYYLDQIIAQVLEIKQQCQIIDTNELGEKWFLMVLSGLEIDVFDLHSKKVVHISSLSGGNKFSSLLALALGLSQIEIYIIGISLE